MEKQNFRKGYETRRLQSSPFDLTTGQRESGLNDTHKFKKHLRYDKKKYETNFNLRNWSAQGRMHSFGQRSFSTSDSSVCHYSVPLSFSFEPVSLPIYSALIQPHQNCGIPIETSSHSKKIHRHKLCAKSKKSKTNLTNEVPAIFHTPRVSNGDQQDYTSLPQVNCDIYYGAKSNYPDMACRRRFSDPGIGQLSSDDSSSSGSNNDNESPRTPEGDSNEFLIVIEQINELKESNCHLRKELQETKLELECMKVNLQPWRTDSLDMKPGTLADAISEIRDAVKVSEEALILKVTKLVEKTVAECTEMQVKLEQSLRQEMDERLSRLEEAMSNRYQKEYASGISEVRNLSPTGDCTIQEQLVELEHEKLQLRKELQEAVAKRKSAEATTEKLEKLVGILRKKINGVSLESTMPEEKQNLVRPLASSLEKNPFIIANNRQGQKAEVLPFQKSKLIPLRANPSENLEVTSVGGHENKENEVGERGNGNECSASVRSVPETNSLTAQVTMTGPVTDL